MPPYLGVGPDGRDHHLGALGQGGEEGLVLAVAHQRLDLLLLRTCMDPGSKPRQVSLSGLQGTGQQED